LNVNPIHEKNLIFLKAVSGCPESETEAVFNFHKKDLRLALLDLLKTGHTDKTLLFEQFVTEKDEGKRIDILHQLMQQFCPNSRFKEIILALKQRKTPKIAHETAEKLYVFRRAPNKNEINQLFDSLNSGDIKLATALLEALTDFGAEIRHQLNYIMMMAESTDKSLAKAALMLIPKIPQGTEDAILVYRYALGDAELRFTALNALQYSYNLNPEMLFEMFTPILQEYERLCRSEGEMNSLWPEFNMIRNILSKNGGNKRVWKFDFRLGKK
jgi:hypothetical protein